MVKAVEAFHSFRKKDRVGVARAGPQNKKADDDKELHQAANLTAATPSSYSNAATVTVRQAL